MIRQIIDSIKLHMISHGCEDHDVVSIVTDAIAVELSKYEIKKKTTAVIVYDNMDEIMCNKFLLSKITAGASPRTVKYYTYVLKKGFGTIGKHIKDITADDIIAYISRMRARGVSNTTADNERRVFSSFFAWAHLEEYIQRNIMLRIQKVKRKKEIKEPLTDEEMELLRAAARTKRDEAIIEFLYSTGCRVGECVALNKCDVDMMRREAKVLGKGNKERIVYMSVRCAVILQQYLGQRKDECPALFTDQKELLRGGRNGREISRLGITGLEHMIRTTGKRAGINGVHPHRLRRTAATVALKRGMPIEQISRMLGHESLNTTTIYAITSDQDVKNSHEKYLI